LQLSSACDGPFSHMVVSSPAVQMRMSEPFRKRCVLDQGPWPS
jgi:hypothetical protein